MYGLPADFDSEFLVGRILELICFSENYVALHFDRGVSIVVQGALLHQHSQAPSDALVVEVPVSNSDLMQCLGSSISAAAGDRDGTLTLVLTNGHTLKCLDTSSEYESYKIEYDGKQIVV